MLQRRSSAHVARKSRSQSAVNVACWKNRVQHSTSWPTLGRADGSRESVAMMLSRYTLLPRPCLTCALSGSSEGSGWRPSKAATTVAMSACAPWNLVRVSSSHDITWTHWFAFSIARRDAAQRSLLHTLLGPQTDLPSLTGKLEQPVSCIARLKHRDICWANVLWNQAMCTCPQDVLHVRTIRIAPLAAMLQASKRSEMCVWHAGSQMTV